MKGWWLNIPTSLVQFLLILYQVSSVLLTEDDNEISPQLLLRNKFISDYRKNENELLQSLYDRNEQYEEFMRNPLITSNTLHENLIGIHRCPLPSLSESLLWWSHRNGTLTVLAHMKDALDLSHRNFYTDMNLSHEFSGLMKNSDRFFALSAWHIKYLSAAHNGLTQVPFNTLSHPRIIHSLMYLTLSGNNFRTNGSAYFIWDTFPALNQLQELDLSNCQITHIRSKSFKFLPNLRKLYMSKNMMLKITQEIFAHIPLLTHLEMSEWQNPFNVNILSTQGYSFIKGLRIANDAFATLPNLRILDLSHSKLITPSFTVLQFLPSTLEILNLCNTAFPGIISREFQNTSIRVLDLSHNPLLLNFLPQYAFITIRNSLEMLFFQNSKLRNINWLRNLRKLRVLKLANNDIEIINETTFERLTDLTILELQNNHIINWYSSVFSNNYNLRLLDLRHNNLNVMSGELLKDFNSLDYLALSGNGFICNCRLITLFESSANNKTNPLNIRSTLGYHQYDEETEKYMQNVYINCLEPYRDMLENSRRKLRQMRLHRGPTFNFTKYKMKHENQIKIIHLASNTDGRSLRLHLQLLDYDSEKYYCYNVTHRISYNTLDHCNKPSTDLFKITTMEVNNYINIIIGNIMAVLVLSVMAVIVYWKRWYLHYYYTCIKLATLWAFAAKNSNDKFLKLKQDKPHLIYDVFISYCQRDCEWVYDELLPNIENNEQISLCLHQRDFEIGVSIMENIVSSMDRSRALMLIISQNSLLSHWCQFEMHLAQHRIIEAYKDHLILIFLENIPRSKRPRTLQYLMDVKTYIDWPSQKNQNQRKIFWHRLKRSLAQLGVIETHA